MTSLEVSEAQGVRYLHFGSDLVQGAMRIARPWALELEYTREMMLPLLLKAEGWPRSVLQVGLGAASLTRFLHRHRPGARVTVVEILPAVVACARQFFRLPGDSPQLRIEIADAHDYLGRAKGRYDLILVDGFDARGRTGMLQSLPFYLNCREHLKPGGLLAANLLSKHGNVATAMERMRAAFDGHARALPPCGAGNTVALASRDRPLNLDAAALAAAADRLRAQSGLDLAPTLKRLA